MAPDKCCFCNTDTSDKEHWFVTVQEIDIMGCGKDFAGAKCRNICNKCMSVIKTAMDKLDSGRDSVIRESK